MFAASPASGRPRGPPSTSATVAFQLAASTAPWSLRSVPLISTSTLRHGVGAQAP